MKYAKWIGGTIGWAMGGPIGALVGFSLGALWDGATFEGSLKAGSKKYETHAGDFYVSLMVLAAAIMKADNKILKSELNYVKRFLRNQFEEDRANQLLSLLKDLLERPIDVYSVTDQIHQYMNSQQRLQLMHFLVGIAQADGNVHQNEFELLQLIAKGLRVSPNELKSLLGMYEDNDDKYYHVLGLDNGASQEDIKRAYRTLVKKYHPDKIGDIGEEAKKAAVDKFRQVQEAYDKLNK